MRAVRRRLSTAIRVVTRLLFASSILVACGPANPSYEVVVNESGSEWKMLSREPYKNDDGAKAIRFRYQSDLKLSDKPALREEVTQFVEEHIRFIRKGGFQTVVVVANTGIKNGWAMARDERSYYFERDQGRWVITEMRRVNDVTEGRRVEVH